MEINKDLIAASSPPLVLAILAEGDSYGYAILKRVQELSGGRMEWTDGMLYPVLHRLARPGPPQGRREGAGAPAPRVRAGAPGPPGEAARDAACRHGGAEVRRAHGRPRRFLPRGGGGGGHQAAGLVRHRPERERRLLPPEPGALRAA